MARDLHSVGNTNTLDTGSIDGLVERKEIDEVGAERVLGRESDLDTLAVKLRVSLGSAQSGGYGNLPLEVLNDLDGSLLDVGHALAVGEFAEEAGGTDDEIDTVDTSAAVC